MRRDLRLNDHPPLVAACKRGAPIIPLYIYDTFTPEIEKPGSANQWWLHQSLKALDKTLRQNGSKLILRQGPTLDVLNEMAKETQAGAIYFHNSCLPGEAALENDIAALCHSRSIECRRFKGELLFPPSAIKTGNATPYKVFTPFWRACQAQQQPTAPLPKPSHISAPAQFPKSDKLDSWQLEPKHPNWALKFKDHWQPGEEGAQKVLNQFCKTSLKGYQKAREFPAIKGSSQLSPYLQNGEISIRTCWHRLKGSPHAEPFLRQLVWREFCYHLISHWPNLTSQPFKEEFKAFPWHQNESYIKLWQQGQTGYPIIDAGMRELWQTGWMHNRVRMIVGSFLVKNLMQHWHVGASWFFDTLLDADSANNSCNWQWVAGSGADAAPYFRIFNPVTQSSKFDKDGIYIRRYVPELAKLATKYIHDPTNAPKEALEKAGISLGKTYPKAIIDLKTSRKTALEAYKMIKSKA